jgi:hypothetical protein
MGAFKMAALDRLWMLASAFALIAICFAVFWVGELYHVSPAWYFMGVMALGFIATAGWDLRSKFKSPAFILFFLAWLAIHLVVVALAIGYLAWLYWIPVVLFEMWVGYTVAVMLFGLPPHRIRQK